MQIFIGFAGLQRAPRYLSETSQLYSYKFVQLKVSRSYDRLRVGGTPLGGVPREQNMLKGHLLRVTYHLVCQYKKTSQVYEREPRYLFDCAARQLYILKSRTDASQKCAAVPKRARPGGSYTLASLNSRPESSKEEEEDIPL